MNYIVIEIQTAANGAVSNLVWAYSSLNTAYQQYHTVLASAAVSALPVHACCLMDNTGTLIAKEVFRSGEEE